MFRRFNVIGNNGQEKEILLNLDHIISISVSPDDGKTYLHVKFGENDMMAIESAYDYMHLADALDGVKFS